jgi:hypothetical protein
MCVQRTRALASWLTLLEHPVARINAEEQYHKLLKAADQMELAGLIDGDEWRQIVRKAGAYFISATRPGTADEEADR